MYNIQLALLFRNTNNTKIHPHLDRFAKPTWPPVPLVMKSGSFKFSFDVTKVMMPRCKMVVYYMRGQEMVADDTSFDVQDILENEVRKVSNDETSLKCANKITDFGV